MNHTWRMCVKLEPRIQLNTALLSVDWPKLRKLTTSGKTLGYTIKLCRCSTQNLKFLKLVLLISWMAGVWGCLQCRQAGAAGDWQVVAAPQSWADCISRRGHQLKTNSRPTKRLLQAGETLAAEAVQSCVTPSPLWWLFYILYFTLHLGEEQILSLVWWIRKRKDRMVLSHFL